MALADAVRRLLGRRENDYLDPEQQEFLREQAEMGKDRLRRYRLYEEYYDGDRAPRILDRARMYLQSSGVPFTENFVETVVDVMADSLTVTGFQVEDNPDASSYLSERVWPRNRGDELQGIVHTETPKLGDGFVIVEWDEKLGRSRMRWNHPRRIRPTYDESCDELLHVSKTWSTRQKSPSNPSGRLIVRLNIWFPDRVEKWFTLEAGDDAVWLPHIDPTDKSWPIWWTTNMAEEGDPLGVSVFHFRNKPKGRIYGRSEVRTAIPFQDELIKQVLDLFYVMDAQGAKQRWAKGIPEEQSLRVAWGEWVKTASTDAEFGEFGAEDPRGLLEAIKATLVRMSAATRTPLHDLITGDIPSGEALKTAEGGRVAKARDRMPTLGTSWSGAARMCWQLDSLLGSDPDCPEFDPAADVSAVWDDPQTRNDRDEAETALIHNELGASKHTLLRKLGYDPDEEAKLRTGETPVITPPPSPADVPPPPNA